MDLSEPALEPVIKGKREAKQARDHEHECRNLFDIRLSGTLSCAMKEWKNDGQEGKNRIDTKRTRRLFVKNEMYQLLGVYSVFQGVVLTAVSQASTLKCHTSWGPASLSALVSIATLFAVYSKSNDLIQANLALRQEEYDLLLTEAKVGLLKQHGMSFDFGTHLAAEVVEQKAQDIMDLEKQSNPRFPLKIYRGVIMGFLVVFSALVLGCCVIIICWQRIDKFGDLP